MATKEVPIELDLQKLLEIPDCSLLKLEAPEPISVQLPGGLSASSFADVSRAIPTDCSYALSLSLQIAPFLMAIECPVKVLKLVEPLKDIIEGLPVPPVEPIAKFVEAAGELVGCFAAFTPLGLGPFLKDLLFLIIKFLKCVIGALETVLASLSGLALKIGEAEALGNDELKKLLECARENAMTSSQTLQDGLGPVMNLLDLVKPLLEIAGVPVEVEIPAAVPPDDLEGLQSAIDSLKDVVAILEQIVETIPV